MNARHKTAWFTSTIFLLVAAFITMNTAYSANKNSKQEKVIKIVKAYKDIALKNNENVFIEGGERGNNIQTNVVKKTNEAFAFDELDDVDEEYEKLLSHEDFRRKAN